MKTIFRLIILFLIAFSGKVYCQSEMVSITGGSYIPLYGRDSLKVVIDDFQMDVYPVTNQQFLAYIKHHPKWMKSKALKLFVDDNYLLDWVSDTALNQAQSVSAPITNISWFVANDYCAYHNKRLPTIDEWEYVAMSNETQKDARTIDSYNAEILSWYEKPKTYNNNIGSTFKNFYGIYDLHGLVWEWTSDFNSVLISGESRKDVDNDSNLFCGSAAINATDLMNYAAFMRYAIRGSLKAKYSMRNLGFRCVK